MLAVESDELMIWNVDNEEEEQQFWKELTCRGIQFYHILMVLVLI